MKYHVVIKEVEDDPVMQEAQEEAQLDRTLIDEEVDGFHLILSVRTDDGEPGFLTRARGWISSFELNAILRWVYDTHVKALEASASMTPLPDEEDEL
ncbi:hypothetical protein LCGC14_2400130 [marine sediment metagenome]|uniref:Uncharacterized protein n=1 Tax=marine sediment metagenome TaxID=412755 RepID=A0A0F9EQ07_9ZZZZ